MSVTQLVTIRNACDHLTHIPGEATVNMKLGRRPSTG